MNLDKFRQWLPQLEDSPSKARLLDGMFKHCSQTFLVHEEPEKIYEHIKTLQGIPPEWIELSQKIQQNPENTPQILLESQTVLPDFFSYLCAGEWDTSSSETVSAEQFRDLRGVSCPLNYAKARVQLQRIPVGETLTLLLDFGSPIENVPRNFASEGHKILSRRKFTSWWEVIVRRNF